VCYVVWQVVCVGDSWLAAATDQRLVRILSITGIQLQLFSVAGPIVSLAASDIKLMTVHHAGLGQWSQHRMMLNYSDCAMCNRLEYLQYLAPPGLVTLLEHSCSFLLVS